MVSRRAFSLLELLLVVLVMGILASIVLAEFQPNLQNQLESVAQIAASELDFARGLAVNFGSKYEVTFDKTQNRIVVEHSGDNTALDTLPPNPFQAPGGSATQRVTDFDDLPQLGAKVKLHRIVTVATSWTDVSKLEFTLLGSTTSSASTLIWLTAGSGKNQRYLQVSVDPVTGVATIGSTTSVAPTSP
jgi:prepilin-type N-terminal cleavage/methylation domain-containing protein